MLFLTGDGIIVISPSMPFLVAQIAAGVGLLLWELTGGEATLKQSKHLVADLEDSEFAYTGLTEIGPPYPMHGVRPAPHLRKAEDTLSSGTSEADWSTVGHYCRLAMQDFAQEVYIKHYPKAAEEPLALEMTKEKIKRVLTKPNHSESMTNVVNALIAYWDTVTKWVQRAEHRSQKEGGRITEEDARHCLLYTYLAIAEVSDYWKL